MERGNTPFFLRKSSAYDDDVGEDMLPWFSAPTDGVELAAACRFWVPLSDDDKEGVSQSRCEIELARYPNTGLPASLASTIRLSPKH